MGLYWGNIALCDVWNRDMAYSPECYVWCFKFRSIVWGGGGNIVYDPYFEELKGKPIDLLEIGVLHGASLMAWKDYFPNGRIVGIDKEDNRTWKRPDVEFIITDVKNYTPDRSFDIIIDDGSHKPEDIAYTFFKLYKYLKPNGLMIIEDVHETFIPKAWEALRELEGKFTIEILNFQRIMNDPYHNLIVIHKI